MKLTRRSTTVGVIAGWATTSISAMAETTGRPMKIGVIGAGTLGSAVGGNWVRAGHEVCFSSRHPERLAEMARALGSKAMVGSVQEAAAFGAVLLLATPYDALPALGRDLEGPWRGKVVLDATNPRLSGGDALSAEAKANGVGPTSARLLPGVRLVRAFNAVDASLIERSAERTERKVAVPIAGDDPEAVRLASMLVVDAGCVPLVVGDLRMSASFQPGAPGFRANTALPDLRRILRMQQEG